MPCWRRVEWFGHGERNAPELDPPPLAHSLVRLVDDAAQLQLLASLAWLARDRARIAFHLWSLSATYLGSSGERL